MSVFFFKQKTAYEMRISDWSSDVCSSDLSANWWRAGWRRRRAEDPLPARRRDRGRCCSWSPCFLRRHSLKRKVSVKRRPSVSYSSPLVRSEEHTSELQSLMRISYAVFCLKKKKQKYRKTRHNRH